MAALVEAVWGHLRRAGEVAAHATALAESGRSRRAAVRDRGPGLGAVPTRAICPAPEDLVQRAAEAAPTHDARVLAAALALVRARLLRAGGDIDLAACRAAGREQQLRRTARRLARPVPGRRRGEDARGTAPAAEAITVIEQSPGRDQVGSLLVLQRAAAEAGERRPRLPPPATDRAVPLETQVDSWLVQAAESIRTGDTGRSGLCLERALRLAAPEQLRRPFTEAPPSLRKLLQPTGELMRRHPWLRAPGLPDSRPRRRASSAGVPGPSWSSPPR